MSLSCSCDVEGYSGHRTRVARKENICGECRKPILPGEEYEFHTFFGDDYISNHTVCSKCDDLAESMLALGFCWLYGDLMEMHQEYLEVYSPPKLNSA